MIRAPPHCVGAVLRKVPGPLTTPTGHYGSLWHLSALGTDAFAYDSWQMKLLYAYPLLCVIPYVWESVMLEQLLVILATPECCSAQ